jgi:hypothetical protein
MIDLRAPLGLHLPAGSNGKWMSDRTLFASALAQTGG